MLVAIGVYAQLPQREPLTVESMKVRFADCILNASVERAYSQRLESRIAELEKQLSDARKHSE